MEHRFGATVDSITGRTSWSDSTLVAVRIGIKSDREYEGATAFNSNIELPLAVGGHLRIGDRIEVVVCQDDEGEEE